MPIYEYKCPMCNHKEEHLVTSQNPEPASCSRCGAAGLERVFSSTFSMVTSSKGAAKKSGTCCGSSTPCASPKHCCGQ